MLAGRSERLINAGSELNFADSGDDLQKRNGEIRLARTSLE
jgi:hypothetical protein